MVVVEEDLLEEGTFYLRTEGAKRVKSEGEGFQGAGMACVTASQVLQMERYLARTQEMRLEGKKGKILRTLQTMANDMHFLLSKTEKH